MSKEHYKCQPAKTNQQGPIVVTIGSSLRNRLSSEKLRRLFSDSLNYNEISQMIYDLGINKKICNTEALSLISMFGAKSVGTEIDYMNLKEYFGSHLNKQHMIDNLEEILFSSDGMVFSTPVYFGDRSSLLDSLLDYLRKRKR